MTNRSTTAQSTVAIRRWGLPTIVTAMDTACERMVREQLLAARPDDGIVGEEGDDVAGSSGVTWVVDPIDGTVNYLYGIPQYAVCVAAVVMISNRPASWNFRSTVQSASGTWWSRMTDWLVVAIPLVS